VILKDLQPWLASAMVLKDNSLSFGLSKKRHISPDRVAVHRGGLGPTTRRNYKGD
jgi:hypothetical protein